MPEKRQERWITWIIPLTKDPFRPVQEMIIHIPVALPADAGEINKVLACGIIIMSAANGKIQRRYG